MEKTEKDARRERFAALLAEGASTRKAAGAVGVAVSTGYEWARPLRPSTVREPASRVPHFARLVREADAGSRMQIDIGGVVIKLESNFDDDALVRVIRIVRGAL